MTAAPLIVPIVEGHGEVEAVPLLLRRIATALNPERFPAINPPTRIKASSFLTDDAYFRKYITLASAKAAQGGGLVLILLDCEDDSPCVLGPQLLTRAQQVRSDVAYLSGLAFREYETWFLTAAESLRGCSGLPDNLEAPADPEAIRGAKEWLGRHMPGRYDPVIHHWWARLPLPCARTILFASVVDDPADVAGFEDLPQTEKARLLKEREKLFDLIKRTREWNRDEERYAKAPLDPNRIRFCPNSCFFIKNPPPFLS